MIFACYPQQIQASDREEGHTVFHSQLSESFSHLMCFFSSPLALHKICAFRLCILCLIQRPLGKLHLGLLHLAHARVKECKL